MHNRRKVYILRGCVCQLSMPIDVEHNVKLIRKTYFGVIRSLSDFKGAQSDFECASTSVELDFKKLIFRPLFHLVS